MLRDAGASAVIVGHSERRTLHHETDGDCLRQGRGGAGGPVDQVVLLVGGADGLYVLAAERRGRHLAACAASIHFQATPTNLVVAGAGGDQQWKPTPICREIRRPANWPVVFPLAGEVSASSMRLPVKASNAAELMALVDVDGALGQGGSLKGVEFWTSASSVRRRPAAQERNSSQGSW